MSKQLRVSQVVIDNDVGLFQKPQPAHRQKPWITGPGPDEGYPCEGSVVCRICGSGIQGNLQTVAAELRLDLIEARSGRCNG